MENYNPFDNQKFRKEMGDMLDDKLKPIIADVEKTQNQVDEHEKILNQQKGGAWVVRALYGGLIVGLEYIFHRQG